MSILPRKQIKITERAIHIARKNLRTGITEKQLADKIKEFIHSKGATLAFPTIVSFGTNARDIHHKPGRKKYKSTDTAIIDIGAKYNGICADMTRTFCLRPGKREKKLFSLVKKAHTSAVKRIRAGVRCKELDLLVRNRFLRLGYKKKAFPHGLGHGVKKKVHSRPFISPRSRTRLRQGQIITIEPGLYLSWGGVRIEDMYLVTKHSSKKLTKFPVKL